MDTPSVVSPRSFIDRMTKHWTTSLGNTPSDALKGTWQAMATAFGQAIFSAVGATGIGDPRLWRVLNPATGAGKTQGTAVYASMLAAADKATDRQTGMLVVVREIADADSFAGTVNGLAGFLCAAARHSENKLLPSVMAETPILVVTHAAYTLALDNVGGDGSRLRSLLTYGAGKRKLVVVDESLSNVVEQHRLKHESVSQVIGHLTPELKASFPGQVAALETVLSLLERIASVTTSKDGACHDRVVWRSASSGAVEFPEGLSMTDLRQAMRTLRYDHKVLRKDSPLDRQRIADNIDRTLSAVETVLSRWAWYSKDGVEHGFNSARLIIPADLPGPVVLDATARQQVLWELLGDRAVIVPIPSGARSYRNVTLHVARTSAGLGKGKMAEEAAKRFPRLFKALEDSLGDTVGKRSVFLCCHKRVEHVPLSFEHPFERLSVAHWGAVDGKNQWKDHDIAVLIGLPFLPDYHAPNLFFATQGLRSTDWLKDPVWKGYANVRKEIERKQLTTSIVQAINRVRCRKVIDSEGNCPAAEAFLVLPKGIAGDEILSSVREEMPGVVVVEWAFDLDGAEVRIRRSSSHEALLTFMANRLPGETPMSQVQKELGITESGRKEIVKCLRESQHPLTQALAALGVSYTVTGKGRGSKSYLHKTSAPSS